MISYHVQLKIYMDVLHFILPKFEIPFLEDLGAEWIDGLASGERLLPGIESAVLAHEVMFDWLAKSSADTGNIT